MTFHLFGIRIEWVRPAVAIVIVRGPEMAERDLNEALAGMSDTHPGWKAINQVIDKAERDAISTAAAHVDQPTVAIAFLGGAKHLHQLGEDLIKRRQLGRKNLDARKPV